MIEWKSVKISDLGEVIGGATPSTHRDDYYNGDIPWLTPKDLAGYNKRYISRGNRNITETGLNSCSAKILPKHSVLFTSRAPIGYIAISENDICTNQGFKSIVPNEKTDYLFLYYLLKYNKNKIENMGSGTTFKEVSAAVMRNIEVFIPDDISVQKKISSLLGALDDKIELNNKINENLEQQAQAIFKSWFVDFEPFDGDVTIQTELGYIPKNWRIYRLSDFLPVITGKKNANISSDKGAYPFFSCSQDFSWTDDYSFEGSAILVAGNGDFNVKWYNGKFEAYQRTYVLIPYNSRFTAWLYYAVKHNLSAITSAARGSVIKFITKGNLENFAFAAPKDLASLEIIDTFTSINETIDANKQENYRLMSIRDSLLPKLMSGELDVSDTEI